MSREAFEQACERARVEVTGIEGVLRQQEAVVQETKQALDKAHATVREKERDLKEYIEAHAT